jgi:cytochrome P450
MPFSYGPRDCLGRRLGWAELRVILATLVWHFDMINRSPENRWEEQLEFVMWEKKPLMLQLTCRQ